VTIVNEHFSQDGEHEAAEGGRLDLPGVDHPPQIAVADARPSCLERKKARSPAWGDFERTFSQCRLLRGVGGLALVLSRPQGQRIVR